MKVGLPKRIAAKLKEASLLSEVYLFKLQNVCVQIVKCIRPNCEMLLYKLQNIFVQIVKCIWNFNECGPAKENWCQKERGNFAVWSQYFFNLCLIFASWLSSTYFFPTYLKSHERFFSYTISPPHAMHASHAINEQTMHALDFQRKLDNTYRLKNLC